MNHPYRRLKYGCYANNVCMSIVAAFQPLLFVTFRERYGVSYSLLGLLILVNFCTQLAIDLVFSFWSHKFNIEKSVKITPVITAAGLFVYALAPILFPGHVYPGLVLGTVIFSMSGGLGEVLISRVIAAIPAEDPDREMSKLHSIYAWGVVAVVLLSTAFLHFAGEGSWQILSLLWMAVPAASALLYAGQPMPFSEHAEKETVRFHELLCGEFFLSMLCIFLGGASEVTMAQWSSGYLEKALGIPKVSGDIFGVAMFSVMLGLGRSLYAKRGKNVERVLLAGSVGAFLCYITAIFSGSTILSIAACALTGLCVSMLWPGNLIVASGRFPGAGVALYAMMAAAGDLGASVAPQLVGIVTDAALANPEILMRAGTLGVAPDRIGMKLGLLAASLFPLLSIAATLLRNRALRKNSTGSGL